MDIARRGVRPRTGRRCVHGATALAYRHGSRLRRAGEAEWVGDRVTFTVAGLARGRPAVVAIRAGASARGQAPVPKRLTRGTRRPPRALRDTARCPIQRICANAGPKRQTTAPIEGGRLIDTHLRNLRNAGTTAPVIIAAGNQVLGVGALRLAIRPRRSATRRILCPSARTRPPRHRERIS